MSDILRSPTTNNAILLQPRSASHTFAIAALNVFWPQRIVLNNAHPAVSFPSDETWRGDNPNVALIVRNPVERFRSMCAHRSERTLEEHLAWPTYGPLLQGNFAKYFRFENQLDEAAEWLGLPTPLPQEDATDPALKPNLTPEQEARVREMYADDIALWESLKENK